MGRAGNCQLEVVKADDDKPANVKMFKKHGIKN